MKRDTRYERIVGRDNYLSLFNGESADEKSKIAKAFNTILDIRKFEIELFWKRTTFFWTTNAAILAGYFSIFPKDSAIDENRVKIMVSLGCLGFLFSLGWYFANRGSKFWQQNWEKHLDCMEDDIVGPLYKTTIVTEYYRDKRRNLLLSAYPFSVSKITMYLSLSLVLFWLILIGDLIWNSISFCPFKGISVYSLMMILATIVAVRLMIKYTHTGLDRYKRGIDDPRKETEVYFEKRGFTE